MLGDAMKNADARIDNGRTLTVKLPLGQLLAMFITAGIVMGGVALTTYDLRGAVNRLANAVGSLDGALKDAEKERRQNERGIFENDARIRVLEKCAEGCNKK